MKRILNPRFLILLAVILTLGVGASVAAAQSNVVYAVLFFSPTCPFCEIVMNEDLPPLQAEYGEQLVILEVDVTTGEGQRMYQQALSDYNAREGVPALAVGENFLIGADDIPNRFPGIIASSLGAGGLAWPTLRGIDSYIEKYGLSSEDQPSVAERYMRDPVGNTVSTILLIAMIVSVLYLGWSYLNNSIAYGPWPRFILPILVLIGIGASAYLTYIEFTNTEAVCGPLGDCNTVQSSSYAYLFGVIPVALLGLIGYVSMGIALAANYILTEGRKQTAAQALWWLALIGTLFSIYLTYLEPFVIGATCAWCLVSALTTSTILWGASPLTLSPKTKTSKRKASRRARTGPIR